METLSEKTIKDKLNEIREHRADYYFFFSKLNSVNWLQPLNDDGYFRLPPSASREGDKTIFPFWPESQYLGRVVSEAPEQVFKILMSMPETDNVRVHEDLVEIATKLPGELAAKWTDKELKWINEQEDLRLLLPNMLGKLIAHLARSGEPDTAMNLAKSVLRIKSAGDSVKDAQGLFGAWDYENILNEYFLGAIRYIGEDGLKLLIKLLEDALAVKSWGKRRDDSYTWRPTIKPSERNLRYSAVRDALVEATRDGSRQLLRLKKGDLPTFVEMLLGHEKPVFKRIVFDLLSEYQGHPLAKEQIQNRDNFFDEKFGPEYTELLSVVFPELDRESKDLILSWIDEGPEENKGDANTTYEKIKGLWQREYLHALKDNLTAEWEERYTELVSRFGEPDPPPKELSSRFFMPTISPKEKDELEGIDADSIAGFLRSWKQTDSYSLERPDRLARTLQEVVAESPDRFVDALDSFREIHPAYSWALIEGLGTAIHTGKYKPSNWPETLDYFVWVIDQSRDDDVEIDKDLFDSYQDWGWARNAVTDFISRGCEKNAIDPKLRERVWDILNVIADDPDPTPEKDEKTERDPVTESINTTRGKALHAIVQYALWVRRTLTKGLEKSEIKFGMSSIPEVQQRLEKHLDPEFDPSPAIRAVFGQWYPWLVLLDENWARDNIDKIFPVGNERLYGAAWDTYLKMTPAYETPFRMLRSQYDTAVEKLSGDRTSEQDDKPSWVSSESSGFLKESSVKLGEHLMVMLSRGVLSWDDKDQLIKRFFKNASVTDAENTIAFVGRSLKHEKASLPTGVVQRFRDFWDCMAAGTLEEIEDSDERGHPFAQFGWWFISGCFDTGWTLKQLQQISRMTNKIEPEYGVMERLAELAEEYPAQSFAVLERVVDWDQEGRNIFNWNQESVETILRAALADEKVKTGATVLIRRLGESGNVQFFDLFTSDSKEALNHGK